VVNGECTTQKTPPLKEGELLLSNSKDM